MGISTKDIMASFRAVAQACPSEATPQMLAHIAKNPDLQQESVEAVIEAVYELKLDSKIQLKSVRKEERALVATIKNCDHLLGTTPAKRVRRVSGREQALMGQIQSLQDKLEFQAMCLESGAKRNQLALPAEI